MESDYSVSSLSLRDKEREREKREIELDNNINGSCGHGYEMILLFTATAFYRLKFNVKFFCRISSLNEFRYNLPYPEMTGGALAISSDQFVQVQS